MPDKKFCDKIVQHAELLRGNGVRTLAGLHACVGHDVPKGIDWVASHTGCSASLLTALLIAELEDDGARKATRDLSRYWKSWLRPVWWPDRVWRNRRFHYSDALVLVLVLLLVAGAATFFVRIARMPVANYLVIKQGVNLPAFHQLTDADLETARAPGHLGSFTNVADVRGRYTLAPLTSGARLDSSRLVSSDLSARLAGRKILSAPLKQTPESIALVPPSEALMILAPRATDLRSASFEVIVLRIDEGKQQRSVTLALTDDEYQIAAPLLASHDVILARRIP